MKTAISLFLVSLTSIAATAQNCKFVPIESVEIKSIQPFQGACANGLASGAGKAHYEYVAPKDTDATIVDIDGNFENGKVHGQATVTRKTKNSTSVEKGTFVQGEISNAVRVRTMANGVKSLVVKYVDGKAVGGCSPLNGVISGKNCDAELQAHLAPDVPKPQAIAVTPKLQGVSCNAISFDPNTPTPSIDMGRASVCQSLKNGEKIDSFAILDFKKIDGQLINASVPTYKMIFSSRMMITDEFPRECAASVKGRDGMPKAGMCWRVWAGGDNSKAGDIFVNEGTIIFEKYESGWKAIRWVK